MPQILAVPSPTLVRVTASLWLLDGVPSKHEYPLMSETPMQPQIMSNPPNETPSRPLSVWPSIPIILVCLIGGGWVIHWYVSTTPQPRRIAVSGNVAVDPTKQSTPRVSHGSVSNHGGNWTVRTTQATADFTMKTGSAALGSAVYNSYSFVPEDAKNTIKNARAIAGDSDRSARLGLDAAQVRQLFGITNNRITMAIAKPDQDLLCEQMRDCARAASQDRPPLEAKVERTLDDIADRSMTATRQQAVDRAAQINAIITPQQWKLNSEILSGK